MTQAVTTKKSNPKANAGKPVLKVKRCHDSAVIPGRKSTGAAGLDLHVLCDLKFDPMSFQMEAYMVDTGLKFEIPEGYHVKIFLRSGTGKKTKLRLANGTGIIDSDYRGNIMLLIENVGRATEYVSKGERLAQFILEKNVEFDIEEVEELTETERGEGGFNSTGK